MGVLLVYVVAVSYLSYMHMESQTQLIWYNTWNNQHFAKPSKPSSPTGIKPTGCVWEGNVPRACSSDCVNGIRSHQLWSGTLSTSPASPVAAPPFLSGLQPKRSWPALESSMFLWPLAPLSLWLPHSRPQLHSLTTTRRKLHEGRGFGWLVTPVSPKPRTVPST